MKTRIGALYLCFLAVALTACQPRGDEVPFETIERSIDGNWFNNEPGLLIATTPDEIKPITDSIDDFPVNNNVQSTLQNTDFKTEFVIAVFLGVQASAHEGIEIEQILRQKEQVSILIREGQPTGSEEESSPYHLVKVRKDGDWDQMIQFTVYLNGNEALSTSVYVP